MVTNNLVAQYTELSVLEISSVFYGYIEGLEIEIISIPEKPLSSPNEQNVGVVIPTEFSLNTAFPNPFNPSTIIKYQLPVDSWVRLKIYNLLGQEVATIVDAIQEAGYKSVEWNAGALPSGVYVYRLNAGNFVSVKKLVLLK